MPGPASFGTYYILMATINAATGLLNGRWSRKQQDKITAQSRELQESMEKNRQNFQLSMNERNAELQKELSMQNHQLRLQEQQSNFEKMCMQAEWNRFLSTWPLMNVPSVIRGEQILPDNKVSLRVIFARNSNQIFTNYVYPRVEAGLREFVDLYHNVFGSRNIIFYDNGFTGNITGGAMEENLHYALKELPVIIIDTNVLYDEICVSLSMWGLGSSEKSHFTVFKIPYQPHVENGNIVKSYYNGISDKLLAYLKFILGYAYDVYNLIQYNNAPLLPKVAAYEYDLQGVRGKALADDVVRDSISQKYDEIYSMIIGQPQLHSPAPYALLPESYKTGLLHILRMEYADSVKDIVPDAVYSRYLDESISAWVTLRTTDTVEKFLQALIDGMIPYREFVNQDDKQYLEKLILLYAKSEKISRYSVLVNALLGKMSSDGIQKEENASVITENRRAGRKALGNSTSKNTNLIKF